MAMAGVLFAKTCAAGDASVLKPVEAGVPRRGAACPGSHSRPKAGPGLTSGLSGPESVLHPLPTPLPEMPQVTLEHPTGKADVSTPKSQGKEAPSCPLSSAPPSTLPEPSCPPMPVAGSLISQSRCGLARPTSLVTLPVTECRGVLPSPRPWRALFNRHARLCLDHTQKRSTHCVRSTNPHNSLLT